MNKETLTLTYFIIKTYRNVGLFVYCLKALKNIINNIYVLTYIKGLNF